MSSSPPLVVADRYRLVAPLGQGGMGRVWRATDVVLHRDVAIKELVPPPGLTPGERQEMRERSLREARAIARLNNVNVVRIFDVLRTDADPWIVMEYVASRSLQDTLASDGPFSPVRSAEIGLGVLGALRAAHRAGVVHRDVKPGNVLLGADGRVVLTDFGLATVPGDPNVTRTGLVLGSPAYIAPERARDGTAGPAADLWSLGATLYASVEGASPFARPSAIATLAALATENPPPARNAGPLKPVLNGLLRKDPTHRINAEEAERLLLRAAGRRSKLTFPMSPTMRRPGVGRERPSLPSGPGGPPVLPGSPSGGSAAAGAAPVVPGPRPPARPADPPVRPTSLPGRTPVTPGRPAAGESRPAVFAPGKAAVGRPAAETPTRVDGPMVEPQRLDATRVDTPAVRDTDQASNLFGTHPGPPTAPAPGPGAGSATPEPEHGALSKTTRGEYGTFTAADVAASRRKKAAPEHERSLTEAAAAFAPAAAPAPADNPVAAPSIADATTAVPPSKKRTRAPARTATPTPGVEQPSAEPPEATATPEASGPSTATSGVPKQAALTAPPAPGKSAAPATAGRAKKGRPARTTASVPPTGEAASAAESAFLDATDTESAPAIADRSANVDAATVDAAADRAGAGKTAADGAAAVGTAADGAAVNEAAAGDVAASRTAAGKAAVDRAVADKSQAGGVPAGEADASKLGLAESDRAVEADSAADGAVDDWIVDLTRLANRKDAPAQAAAYAARVDEAGAAAKADAALEADVAVKAGAPTEADRVSEAPASTNADHFTKAEASSEAGRVTKADGVAEADGVTKTDRVTKADRVADADGVAEADRVAGAEGATEAGRSAEVGGAESAAAAPALAGGKVGSKWSNRTPVSGPQSKTAGQTEPGAAGRSGTTAAADEASQSAVPLARAGDTSISPAPAPADDKDEPFVSAVSRPSRPAWTPMPVRPKPGGITVFGTRLTYLQAAIGGGVLLVVLLLVIVLAAKAFGGGSGKPSASATTPIAAATTAPASGPASLVPAPTKATTQPSSAAPSATAPTKTPPSSALPSTGALPGGWQMYRDGTGFSVPIWSGASITRSGSEVYFQKGNRLLIVDQTDQPKPDPVQDWKDQEASRAGRAYRDYQRIKIVKVNYFQNAADWEFTYTTNKGNAQHAVKRGVVINSNLAYGLSWYTSPDDWAASQADLQRIYQGFQPKR